MKEQEIYIKVPGVPEWGERSLRKLNGYFFTPEEFEAEKLKIASEAWDAGYLKGKDHFDINYIGEPLPSKEAFIQSLKT